MEKRRSSPVPTFEKRGTVMANSLADRQKIKNIVEIEIRLLSHNDRTNELNLFCWVQYCPTVWLEENIFVEKVLPPLPSPRVAENRWARERTLARRMPISHEIFPSHKQFLNCLLWTCEMRKFFFRPELLFLIDVDIWLLDPLMHIHCYCCFVMILFDAEKLIILNKLF